MDHVRGTPDLDEEHVWSYSLSLEQTFAENRVLQATLFRSDHHDLDHWQTRLEATVKMMTDQYSDMENTEEEKLDNYTTMDIKVGQPLTLASHKAEIYAKINNLTDTGYAIHYGYPDDGLRLLVGLNMKF